MIELPEGGELPALRRGKRPNFLHLPGLGDRHFAHLDVVATVAKAAFHGLVRKAGVSDRTSERRLAGGFARWFGRFPFPDEVSDAMRALRSVAESSAPREQSPFGQVLRDVVELRAESPAWHEQPCDVTLVFVVDAGALPTFEDDVPPETPDPAFDSRFALRKSDPKRALTQLSTALGAESRAVERHWLWWWLAEAAADLCNDQARRIADKAYDQAGIPADLRDYATASLFSCDVVSADDFPLSRFRTSELVDLAHLSEPATFDLSA